MNKQKPKTKSAGKAFFGHFLLRRDDARPRRRRRQRGEAAAATSLCLQI